MRYKTQIPGSFVSCSRVQNESSLSFHRLWGSLSGSFCRAQSNHQATPSCGGQEGARPLGGKHGGRNACFGKACLHRRRLQSPGTLSARCLTIDEKSPNSPISEPTINLGPEKQQAAHSVRIVSVDRGAKNHSAHECELNPIKCIGKLI